MADDIKVCPSCGGEGGFGVKDSPIGWSTCWRCGGTGKVTS